MNAVLRLGMLLAWSCWSVVACRAGEEYRWPDAPPVILREELFGIRFRLALDDKGAEGAQKLLLAEVAKGTPSEVQAYVAWVSLWPDAWGLKAIWEPQECERHLLSAVEAGSAQAAEVLARVRLYGTAGLKKDEREGLRLLDLAVERGSARALGRRGVFRVTGEFGMTDPGTGFVEVTRAASHGSLQGVWELAQFFERRGLNGFANPTTAMEYCYALALQNDGDGWRKLEEWEQQQLPRARLLRSLAYVRFVNEGGFIAPTVLKKHLAFLEGQTEVDPRIAVEVGAIKLRGGRYTRRDLEGARRLFTNAAKKGNDDARFFLAYMRVRGLAGPQELAEGLREITALADAGHARAAEKLGYFYYWGTAEAGKIPRDPAKAFHYCRVAAEAGSRSGAENLAHCYKHGIGTKENPVLAARLYWLAWKYGVFGAKAELVRQLPFAKVP